MRKCDTNRDRPSEKVLEDERKRISLELHDTVARDLISLKLLVIRFLMSFQMSRTKNGKNFCIFPGSCKNPSTKSGIFPMICIRHGLESLGFDRAIYQNVSEFSEKTGISVEVTSDDLDPLPIDYDTKINL